MITENIKLKFAHKTALQIFTAGLNAMFLINYDNIDYITYYNFRRFYAQALRKLQNEHFKPRRKKEITLPVELNVYNSICQMMSTNTDFLKHSDNRYLLTISLDIHEQGRQLLMQKQAFMLSETKGF